MIEFQGVAGANGLSFTGRMPFIQVQVSGIAGGAVIACHVKGMAPEPAVAHELFRSLHDVRIRIHWIKGIEVGGRRAEFISEQRGPLRQGRRLFGRTAVHRRQTQVIQHGSLVAVTAHNQRHAVLPTFRERLGGRHR